MKKYSTIIFDIDGTLLNTSSGIISSVDYVIEQLNLPEIDQLTKESFIGPMIHSSFRRVYHLDDEKTAETANMFRTRYSEVDLAKAELYDGVPDLLFHLKERGLHLGVATYKRQDYAEKILQIFGISEYFECIIGSDYNGELKKQDIINLCIERLGNEKMTTLMIGDTENDRIGAANADIDFLAVTYGFGFRKGDSIDCSFADSVEAVKSFIIQEKS